MVAHVVVNIVVSIWTLASIHVAEISNVVVVTKVRGAISGGVCGVCGVGHSVVPARPFIAVIIVNPVRSH